MGKVAEYDKIWKGICGKQKQYDTQQICRTKNNEYRENICNFIIKIAHKAWEYQWKQCIMVNFMTEKVEKCGIWSCMGWHGGKYRRMAIKWRISYKNTLITVI